MRKEELLDYLKSYKHIKLEAESIRESLESVRCISYGDAGGGYGRPTEQRYNAMIDKYDEKIDRMYEIESFVIANFKGVGCKVIMLYYIKGLTYKEIADKVGCSVSSVDKYKRSAIDSYLNLR